MSLFLFQRPLVIFLVHELVLVAELVEALVPELEALVEEVDDLLLERVLVVVVVDLLLVGEHLADQLLLPMALARGGSFTTVPPSRHTTTNIEIIRKFLDVEIGAEQITNRSGMIKVK